VKKERFVERTNRRVKEVRRGRERNGTSKIIKETGKSTRIEAEGSSEKQWLKGRCVLS
jgi:hypothetical protein